MLQNGCRFRVVNVYVVFVSPKRERAARTHYAIQLGKDASEVEPMRGLAGHYDVSPDENPILGRHPEHPALLIAAGFSGHGLMLAPAAGRMTSDLIRNGRSEALDPRPYRLSRFAENDPIIDPQI